MLSRTASSSTGLNLRKIGPGFYVDARGEEYFYLTDMYLLVSKSMTARGLITPASVALIFDELRQSLEQMLCTELMD